MRSCYYFNGTICFPCVGLLRAGEVFGGEAEDVADAFLQDMVGGENKKGLEEEEEEDVMDLI